MGVGFDEFRTALADRYALNRELGRGGMATVYLAEDLKHQRKVAVKVLRPELAATLGPDRFVREIRIAAQLTHPHVLPLFDSGEAAGFLYYVMPYIEGESLRDRLTREGRLPVADVIRLTDQFASALTYAHGHGIIHRDIKPENILLAGDQAIVADFGIAHAVEAAGGDRLTATGLAVGTPAYMSPEQGMGAAQLDARTDVYALGCVVYEMLAGRAPFQGATPQALLARHVADAVPDLRTTDPEIPLFVQRAVERAMAKEPDDRFPSAAAFAEALTSGTVVARVRRRQVSRRWWTGVVAVLVVTAGWWLGRSATASHVRALAVLPLTNLSGDTAQGYFVDGVHEQLISELAQTGVTVIARSSVMQYRNTAKSVAEIARDLNVDAVVEGGVFRAGDSVEIETRLIEAGSNVPMWRGRYGATLANVVALYRGITRALADKIEIALSPEAEARLARRDSVKPEVYEAYLRGMHYLDGPGPQDNEIGIRYLQHAVDQNPVDARAWAGLASGYITIGHSFAPTAEARDRAGEAARRAVRLDPNLADGWAALAAVQAYYEQDWAGAEEAFQRANALNPSLPVNHYHYAWFLDLFRRWDQAVVEHKRAAALDPFMPAPSAWLGLLYADAGRVDEGIKVGEEAAARFPDAPVAKLALGWTYLTAGRWDDAIATFQLASAMRPRLRGFLAWAYAGAGRVDEARAMADRLEATPNSLTAFALVATYSRLGDWDRAIRWLEYQPRHVWMAWWLTQKAPPELRRRPEFRALVHEMHLDSLIAEG